MKWIYTTFAHQQDAEAISASLVDEGVVACANLFPQIKSIYKWQDQLKTETEVAVLLKTSDQAVSQASARLKDLHPYECPCIVVIDVAAGHPLFDQWISTATKGPAIDKTRVSKKSL